MGTLMTDDYGLLEAIRLGDLPQIRSLFFKRTKDKPRMQQMIVSTLQRTAGGNRDVPFLLAATVEDHSIFTFFVTECGIDVNQSIEIDSSFREYTFAIISAIRADNLPVLDWILSNGGDPSVIDGKGWTPLHHAVSNLSYHCTKRLLRTSNKDIDLENSEGQTALHIAAKAGHIELVKLLIDVGKSSVGSTRSFDGMTPIHVAAKEGNYHLVQLFCEKYNVSAKLQYKCRLPDGKSYVLRCPIHVAAAEGNAATVRVLLKYSEANALDSVGNTPLHCCFMQKYSDSTMKSMEDYEGTVKALIQHGCNPSLLNARNESPIDLARMNGFHYLIDFLNPSKRWSSFKSNRQSSAPINGQAEVNTFKQRPPSAVLTGTGSLGFDRSVSNTSYHIESEITDPSIIPPEDTNQSFHIEKSIKQSSGGSVEKRVKNLKLKTQFHPAHTELEQSATDNTAAVHDKSSSMRKSHRNKTPINSDYKTDSQLNQSESNPERSEDLTQWLKQQAKLLKDKDKNEKTVPMAQSTPPPTMKMEKSPSQSKQSLPGDKASLLVKNSKPPTKQKPPPPPPKSFKHKNFVPVKPLEMAKNDDSEDNASSVDQSFESPEPPKPVPKPRIKPATENVETFTNDGESDKAIPKKNIKYLAKKFEQSDSSFVKVEEINKWNKKVPVLPVLKHTLSEDLQMSPKRNKSKEVESESGNPIPPKAVANVKPHQNNENKSEPVQKPIVKKPPLQPPAPVSSDEEDEEESESEEESEEENENAGGPQFMKTEEQDDEEEEEDEEEEDDDIEESDQEEAEESENESREIGRENINTRTVFVSKNSDKKLGFSVVGGNNDGIFIHTVHKNPGLKPGDRIIEVNGRPIMGKTKEEVYKLFESITSSSDKVSLELANDRAEVYKEIVKNGGSGGDRFYVRAKFSHDGGKKRELRIREGDVFFISDTYPEKFEGLWKAQRISLTTRKSDDIGSGYICNRQKADQIALKQHLNNNSNRNSGFMRSFRRTKSAERIAQKNGRLNESADAFNSSLTIVGYERVSQAPPSARKRLVIILGLFCDVVVSMLAQDSPDLFFIPPPSTQLEVSGGEFDDAPVDIQLMQKLMTASENIEKKHLLTIMSPSAIDYLIKKTTFDPIVIFISPVSKTVVKAVKSKLAPHYDKNPSHLYDEASKFEKAYSHLFSAIVSYTTDNWWFFHVKDTVNQLQQQSVWIPEELALIVKKKVPLAPKLVARGKVTTPTKLMSRTMEDLHYAGSKNTSFDNDRHLPDKKILKNDGNSSLLSLPPRGKPLQQQQSRPAPVPAKRIDSHPPVMIKRSKSKEPVQEVGGKAKNQHFTKIEPKAAYSTSNDDEDEDEEEDEESDDEDVVDKTVTKQTFMAARLESCPQTFGKVKRLNSDNNIPEQKILSTRNLDPLPPQSTRNKNMFVRPSQAVSTNNLSFGNDSFENDLVLNSAPVDGRFNRNIVKKVTSVASRETPL